MKTARALSNSMPEMFGTANVCARCAGSAEQRCADRQHREERQPVASAQARQTGLVPKRGKERHRPEEDQRNQSRWLRRAVHPVMHPALQLHQQLHQQPCDSKQRLAHSRFRRFVRQRASKATPQKKSTGTIRIIGTSIAGTEIETVQDHVDR
nr:hypothetical protein [Alloyangia pacifica]